MRLSLARRLQAEALGGLDHQARRQLQRRGPLKAEGLGLGIGAILRREWQGSLTLSRIMDGNLPLLWFKEAKMLGTPTTD